MLRFIFGTKKTAPKVETQRETFVRLAAELTALMDTMTLKPKITVDPNSGAVTFEAPEQFPDEALALPAPDTEIQGNAETQKDEAA